MAMFYYAEFLRQLEDGEGQDPIVHPPEARAAPVVLGRVAALEVRPLLHRHEPVTVSVEHRNRVHADHIALALEQHRLHELVVLPVVLPLFLAQGRLGRGQQRMKGGQNIVKDAPEAALEVLLREVVGMAKPVDHKLATHHKVPPFPFCPP